MVQHSPSSLYQRFPDGQGIGGGGGFPSSPAFLRGGPGLSYGVGGAGNSVVSNASARSRPPPRDAPGSPYHAKQQQQPRDGGGGGGSDRSGGLYSQYAAASSSSHAEEVAAFFESDDEKLMKRFQKMVREGATRVRQVGIEVACSCACE
jgi:hypothetical protein